MVNKPRPLKRDEIEALLVRLRRYGRARNRTIDHEERTITITDDEAAWLFEAGCSWHAGSPETD